MIEIPALRSPITGMANGMYPVGVTTIQFDDPNRIDPGNPKKKRGLQTEIWYPAIDDASRMTRTRYSEYLGVRGCINVGEATAQANEFLGTLRNGLTIDEIDDPKDKSWLTDAVRDVKPRDLESKDRKWPLVLFSHGPDACRSSYLYWTEFLASQGFVVAACDHPGSASFTIVDGKVIQPGGLRSFQTSVELERPRDLMTVLNGMQRLSQIDSRFAGKVDCDNVAVTGVSVGGYTAAAVLERNDPRIKAAVMKCPTLHTSGEAAFPNRPNLHLERRNKMAPVLIMVGGEDTTLGEEGIKAARRYVDSQKNGDNHAYIFEIARGGHASFTSCELFNPDYGDGILSGKGRVKSCFGVTTDPETDKQIYRPLDILSQHNMINSYGLAFLNTYLRPKDVKSNGKYDKFYLSRNKFASGGELIYRKGKSRRVRPSLATWQKKQNTSLGGTLGGMEGQKERRHQKYRSKYYNPDASSVCSARTAPNPQRSSSGSSGNTEDTRGSDSLRGSGNLRGPGSLRCSGDSSSVRGSSSLRGPGSHRRSDGSSSLRGTGSHRSTGGSVRFRGSDNLRHSGDGASNSLRVSGGTDSFRASGGSSVHGRSGRSKRSVAASDRSVVSTRSAKSTYSLASTRSIQSNRSLESNSSLTSKRSINFGDFDNYDQINENTRRLLENDRTRRLLRKSRRSLFRNVSRDVSSDLQ